MYEAMKIPAPHPFDRPFFDPSKPLGVPVEGCPVCEALHKGDVKSINSQPHDAVMKHITENHSCDPPALINGYYYLDRIYVTVVLAAFRQGKYDKVYCTIPARWEEELNKFSVCYDDEKDKTALIQPKDVFAVRIQMDYD